MEADLVTVVGATAAAEVWSERIKRRVNATKRMRGGSMQPRPISTARSVGCESAEERGVLSRLNQIRANMIKCATAKRGTVRRKGAE
mgnify:CR=1 FL=1